MTAVTPADQGPPPAYPPPPEQAYPPPPDAVYPPPDQKPPPPGYQPPPPGYQPPPPGYQPPPPGYQPPPPGYAFQHQTMDNTVVVVTQPGFGGPQPGSTCRYHSSPALIVCQHCNATVTTSTSYSVGTYTWLIAAIILFLGFWLGCCLIPFCIDSCKDVIHSCPNCRCTVGRFSRL